MTLHVFQLQTNYSFKVAEILCNYNSRQFSKRQKSFPITKTEKFPNGGHVCQFTCFQMVDKFANSHVSKWRTCLPIHMFQDGGHVCQFLCFKMADMFANSHVSKWRTCFSLQKQTTNLKLQTNMFANYTTRPKVSNGGQVCQLHKQTSSFKMVDMFVNYTNRPQVSKWRTSFQITVCKKQTTSLNGW